MEQHQMLGSLISAGASLAGGFLGQKNAKDARESTERMAQQNIDLQREFAQSGIQWRTADALKAGIHPIYALGSAGASFSPVSANFSADTSLPNALASAGQDIGRAVNATRTGSQRVDAYTKTAQALQLENQGLQNENLKIELASKTARLNQQANPPMPAPGDSWLIPGQAQSGQPKYVESKPFEQTPGDPSRRSQELGANPDTGHLRTSGGLFPVPGQKAKEAIEDNFYQETMHFIRNNLLPMIAPAFNQPPHAADKGQAWVYDPVYGYKQVRDTRLNKFLRYGVQK